MTNERHTRREFLGIAGAGVAGVATGASFDHKRSEKPSHFWLHNSCTIAAEQGSFAPK